jgi:hypothetical protein
LAVVAATVLCCVHAIEFVVERLGASILGHGVRRGSPTSHGNGPPNGAVSSMTFVACMGANRNHR